MRRFVFSFVTLLLLLPAAPALSDSGDEEVLRRRDRREREGEPERRVRRVPRELRSAIDAYKERKYLTSSERLFDLLESEAYPEHEARIRYYLGADLKAMGLLHAAQVQFQAVVREGPQTGALFASALGRMVEISDRTNDPIYLVRSVGRIDPRDFPARVEDDLWYYLGVRDFERGNLDAALDAFERVGRGNDHHVQALYHLAVIAAVEGRDEDAVDLFAEIAAGDLRGDPVTVARVQQLSLIGLARIRYAQERYEASVTEYETFPRETGYWPVAMYESAWGWFRQEGGESRALGQLQAVRSPFFDHVWLPEAPILEALTLYRMCEFDEVLGVLDSMREEAGPLAATLDELLEPHATGELPLGELYRRLYGVDSEDHRRIPAALFAHIEADRRFAGPHNRVLQIERELARIGGLKPQWRDAPVGRSTERTLLRQRRVYMRLSGAALGNALAEARDQLVDLMSQDQLLRFEVLSGQLEDLVGRADNPVPEVVEEVRIGYATSTDRVYWPWAGEYWRDELGYYDRPNRGACVE